MSVLVLYASKHGATQGIAERIAAKLVVSGQEARALPILAVKDLSTYDAFVIGSAAYTGSWMKDATTFVRRNQAFLATRPVWLFSSGPLGASPTDAQGRDLLAISEPKEFAEFKAAIKPRGFHVFFGALSPAQLTFAERMFRRLPAGRELLPEGDFRDWKAIDAWAVEIAAALAPIRQFSAESATREPS